MGRFTKRLIGGVAIVSLLAGGAFAQVQKSLLDDFSGGTNQNKFGQYWYFYDDNEARSTVTSEAATGIGNSTVNSAQRSGSELLFTAEKSLVPSTSTQSSGGTAAVLDYTLGRTFKTGYDNRTVEKARNAAKNPNYYAVCPSDDEVKAESWKIGCAQHTAFVGIGTSLVPDGQTTAPKGFENATSLIFWARADEAMSVRFVMETSDIDPVLGAGAFLGRWIDIGTSWAPYTVNFTVSACNGTFLPGNWPAEVCPGGTDLVQPHWAIHQGHIVPSLDKSKVVKLAWQVQASEDEAAEQGNKNPNVLLAEGTSNKFYLDEVTIVGFRFVAEDMCEDCVVSSRPADAVKFDAFQTGDAKNRLDWYWYAYDDTKTVVDNPGQGDGSSMVVSTEGTNSVNCEPSEYRDPDECGLEVVDGTLQIRYLLGDNLLINTHTVQPFIGIGTNLYGDRNADNSPIPPADFVFYNAGADGVSGVYFEYKTTAPKITFEVQDDRDVRGQGGVKRPESAVWYIDLPGTNGEWQRARVPFSRLMMHTEWEDVKAWADANPSIAPLNLSALAKFQFKVQSAAASMGELHLREIYTIGGSGNSVRHIGPKAAANGLRATYSRGVVNVNWNATTSVASGKISLVNTKGRVISSAPISKASGNRITANIGGRAGIPTGMYFVRVDAKDVNGKRILQQAPITIVK